MVVYNIATSGVAGVGTTIGTLTPGYWYYDNKTLSTTGGTWKPLGGLINQLTLTSPTSPAGNTVGQVAYNTSAIAPTGLIYWDGTQWKPIAGLSQVALTSATSPTGSAVGDMRYNTTPLSGPPAIPVGPVYWDGSQWKPVGSSANGWGLTGNSATSPNNNFIGTTDNNDLVFKTNNTETMRATATGNIGIQTANPVARMELVTGDLPASDGSGFRISNQAGAPTGSYAMFMGVNKSLNYGFIKAATVNGNVGNIILNDDPHNGNVGIGTTAPGSKLHIAGNIAPGSVDFAVENTGNGGSAWHFQSISNFPGFRNGTLSIAPYTNGASSHVMNITTDGKVGIGTYTPTATLDILGNAKIADGTQGAGKVLTSDANGLASWQTLNGTAWGLTGNTGTTPGTNFIGTTDSIDFVAKTNNRERMRVFANGKVGIGTNNATPYDEFTVLTRYGSNHQSASGSALIVSADSLNKVNPSYMVGSEHWLNINTTSALAPNNLLSNSNGSNAVYTAALNEVSIVDTQNNTFDNIFGTVSKISDYNASNPNTARIKNAIGVSSYFENSNPNDSIKYFSAFRNNSLIANYSPGYWWPWGVGRIQHYYTFFAEPHSANTGPDYWQFYGDGNEKSYIGGQLLIGSNTVPPTTTKLAVTGGSVQIADGTQGAGKVLTSDADGLASWQNDFRLYPGGQWAHGPGTAFPNGANDIVNGAVNFDQPVGGGNVINGVGAINESILAVGNSNRGMQLDNPYGTTDLYIRNGNSDSGGWGPWVKILTANNAGSFGWSLTGNAGTTPGTNFIGTTDAQDLAFKVNNTEVVRVTNNGGNVGIGTATPQAKLHIEGLPIAGEFVRLSYNSPGGDYHTISGSYNSGTPGSSFLQFNVESGTGPNQLTSALRLYGSGSAVIGDNSFASGHDNGVAVVASTSSSSDAAHQLAKLTVAGGDASINGLTVGVGGGQASNNTAVGNQVLFNNTTGNGNTAIGQNALQNNTTGNSNTANGLAALQNNTTGKWNTAIGQNALGQNITANNNVAAGYDAGFNQTSGDKNIVIGANQDLASLTGSNQLNIGGAIFGTGLIGNQAVPAGNIGIGTTAPGARLEVNNGSTAGAVKIVDGTQGAGKVLTSDANGLATWQTPTGGGSAGWSLTGNAGTTAGTNFIGTTDAQDLAFKTNNSEVVRVASNGNVGIGTANPTRGLDILSVGGYWGNNGGIRLQSNNPGIEITDLGSKKRWLIANGANSGSDGIFSVATWNASGLWHPLAIDTLNNIMLGQSTNNTPVVPATVASATSGSDAAHQLAKLTVSGGDASINGLTVGKGGGQDYQSTALGLGTLANNTTGSRNMAVGIESLGLNTTGSENMGVGYFTLSENTTGMQNTAVGNGALQHTGASSSYNTALGLGAAQFLTGNYNTIIGFKSGTGSNGGLQAGDNNIVIGSNQTTYNMSGSNQLNIGGAIFGTGLTGNAGAPAGNIGIGTTAPEFRLTTVGDNGYGWAAVFRNAAGSGGVNIGSKSIYAGSESPLLGAIQGVDGNDNIGDLMLNPAGGNVHIGGQAGNSTDNSFPAVGRALVFHTGRNADNTDPIYFFRKDTGLDVSELHLNIGDDGQPTDAFVIGYTTADVFRVQANGDVSATGTVYCSAVANTSDARLKTNVRPLANGLDNIMKLRPVSYDKKTAIEATAYDLHENGFIAQEVQKVMPELVTEGKDKDKILTLNYTAIIPVLTQAMQQQQTEIKDLKAENQSMKAELEAIKAKLGIK
jgi:hypothetical protein